jgi:hypothetical protein
VLQPDEVRAATRRVVTSRLDLHAGNGLDLLGITDQRRLVAGQALRFGVGWSWRGGEKPLSTSTLFAHLVDTGGRSIGGSDRTLLPTSLWQVGQEVIQWGDIPIDAQLSPGRYFLELGFYDERGARSQLLDDAGRSVGTSVLWGPLVVAPPPAQGERLTPVAVPFGNSIELTGYRASAAGLTLEWQARGRPDRDFTVFVHVVNAAGAMAAQADSPPVNGDFPTGAWLPGDVIRDTHRWNLPPGMYRVQVGLYDVHTLARAPGGPLEFDLSI